MSVEVFVPATQEGLDAQAYLLANPDVAAAGVDAIRHFQKNGQREGRLQINPILLQTDGYRRRKFNRFKKMLTCSEAEAASGFPVIVGGHFSLDQYAAESANEDFGPFASAVRASPEKHFIDLGCGLRRQVYENCLYVEVYPSIAADLIVPPTCEYPIEDATIDGVGCFSVLEHTRKPWLVVGEIHRMLRPGGTAWISWPFLQPVHGFPSHFYNSTREGLTAIFEDAGFAVQSAETLPHEGPDWTITWILSGFLRALPDDDRKRVMSMTVEQVLANAAQTPFWRELLAHIDDSSRSTFACGNTLTAIKT